MQSVQNKKPREWNGRRGSGGAWQKVKEQKKKVNIRGKVGGIRCGRLAVHLCAFLLCTYCVQAGMDAGERETKKNRKTVEFNTGTP